MRPLLLFGIGLIFISLALLGVGYLLVPQERHSIINQATLQPPTATSIPTRAPIPTPSSTLTSTPTATATQIPEPTSTPIDCVPPGGWTPYIVQPGDNLFRLSLRTNATVEQIMLANCLTGGNTIFAGQLLYLPPLPRTKTPTTTPTITPASPPQSAAVRINFPAGSTSVTFIGVLGTEGKVLYMLSATRGQTLSVKVTGPVNEIAVAIYASDGTALKLLDTALTWSGKIPSNGDYFIDIVSIPVGSNNSYTLEVSLTTPASASTPPATETVPPGEPTSTPVSAAALTYLFEAEWPARMEIGISNTVRVSLIKAGNEYLPTVEIAGHTAVVSTPMLVGTPGQELPSAFGTEYKAYATASLVGVTFVKDPASFSPQPLDQPRIDWIWSISSDKPGLQRLSVSVQIEWRRTDNSADTRSGQVWRPPDIEIEVFQPIISTGQISLLSLISGFIGSGLSFPWLYGIFRTSKKVVPRKVKDKKRR